jgi:stage V sporulation protein D (sporulation-specific penicillin-binding protein)
MERILPYLGVKAEYTEEEKEALTVRVPDCTGWSAESAAQTLAQSGISYNFVGEGTYVTGQIPAAGAQILKNGACITLTLGTSKSEMQTVPNLVGMTAAEANRTLINAGFNLKVIGARDYLKSNKIVMAQDAAAGALLPRGSVIVLRFAYDEIAE